MAVCVSLRNWVEVRTWWDILFNNGDGYESMNADRISELPEELILQILSLLPVEEAITTGVLSKQWQSHWKKLPNLGFYFCCKSGEFRTFSRNVCKVLLSQKALVLQTLHLNLMFDASNSMDARMLIRIALSRNCRELFLVFTLSRTKSWFRFPFTFYISQTLETLRLRSIGFLEVPCSSVWSLKSLKTLHLEDVDFEDEESVVNFLSGCPNLEDFLVFKSPLTTTVKTFTIAVPSLQRLTIYDHSNDLHADAGYVINAPCLKYLKIHVGAEIIGFCRFENVTNKLVEVNLILVSKIIKEKLLESDLTSVKRLSLKVSPLTIKLPTGSIFYQLVYLELHTNGEAWCNLLLHMLNTCPKLQLLKLIDRLYWRKEIPAFLFQPKNVPECFLFHLETFIWEGYRWNQIEVAKYILSNTKRLKSATFFFSTDMNLEQRPQMVEDLTSVVRASDSCQLLFESMKYRNGLIHHYYTTKNIIDSEKNGEPTKKTPSLALLPNDVLSTIISKVAKSSREDVRNCILTCWDVKKSAKEGCVYKNMVLNDLVTTPLLAVYNFKVLMEDCILHSNPSAHYVKGVLEYFLFDNPAEGLFHLYEAANASPPIPEAIYLYGIINLCISQFEEGKEYLNMLHIFNDNSKADECWVSIKRALHGIGILRKQEYVDALYTMLPPFACNLNDMVNSCELCYHYKQMMKFVFTI